MSHNNQRHTWKDQLRVDRIVSRNRAEKAELFPELKPKHIVQFSRWDGVTIQRGEYRLDVKDSRWEPVLKRLCSKKYTAYNFGIGCEAFTI